MKTKMIILLLFIATFTSCNCDDCNVEDVTYEYIIVNKSGYNLVIDSYDSNSKANVHSLAVDNNSTVLLKFTISEMESEGGNPKNVLKGDSILINFQDGKKLVYLCKGEQLQCTDERNILAIDNYIYKSLKQRYSQYTYIFTEIDYLFAL